ncbi:hypothetical protein CEXT_773371 [Caerostris extrusa]|uniref:Uncharacterized protein n=1 Tax=Caerostris extrusa TaxID=172846 RepID=A0AAV4YDQ1_CAEEX|nr:hypothetical protein CEXT_773371 [Caerostris extrusa]
MATASTCFYFRGYGRRGTHEEDFQRNAFQNIITALLLLLLLLRTVEIQIQVICLIDRDIDSKSVPNKTVPFEHL